MPIDHNIEQPDVIHTILSGRVTDDELLVTYRDPVFKRHSGRWIVDGSKITEVAVTPEGQKKLAEFVESNLLVPGGKVAMVAGSEATYGMFRRWEQQREALGDDVYVFRTFEDALAWVTREQS